MNQIKALYMRRLLIRLFICIIFISSNLNAQEPLRFWGYLSEMPYVTTSNATDGVLFDNLIHNRLNLSYEINQHFNAKISFRNRLFSGESVNNNPNFKYIVSNDQGVVDLSFNWSGRTKSIMNTSVDRFWFEYVTGKFQVKLGRQRVNWSQTMVWNPNDIFNSYSYFDFDYEERPGMDGLRLQYFTGLASNVEAVVKIDRNNDVSSAALYRLNFKGYDLQFIVGEVNQEDYILGGGWSGDIKGAGFYGEVSYLKPIQSSQKDAFIFSSGGNYTLKNGLLMSAEYLYSSNLNNFRGDFNSIIYYQSSVKNLSFADHSYVVSGSFPITPLLNVSMAYMGFGYPVFKNFYLGPTVDYSLTDNLYLSVILQYFSSDFGEVKSESTSSFFRLKWNF